MSGWRKNRKDSFLKKFTSRGANLLRGIIVKDNIHDSGCSLKVYRKECFQNINLYGEMHRFIPALLKIKGFNIGELVVNHRPRTAGKTKYNWKRTVKGFIDMISVWFWNKYAVRPLHLLGSTGIVMIFLGIICAMWTTLLFINGIDLTDNFQPMITIVFLLSGLFCIISGFICDILLKIYFGLKVDLPYSVKDMIRNENVDV
ncbi:MAG: hypothetical protein LBV09_03955 [Deferribacteraceae bacterium]|nr:hypothetical protein [Deferribacteraceae bacterium]